ncbi:MAG: general secretion pathway protein GspK [Candidatus Omnitrophica bacterium]|nr:general secretion pathway protein GspK [Candidatus Omnitrophota bacterium]MBU4488436.1 general secretion pathway protein GspK [Candidatus Omnitrophota bacterium]MCG2705149.1 type II secretion system protein GspK [Candidatus Omnitrophota bacterium]
MNKKGIALIMAVGVLALLAVLATSFALNMRLEYHAAVNYYNGVKARYFAESALQRAIAELRTHVKGSAFDYFGAGEDWALTTHPTNTASLYNNHNIIAADIAATPPRITSKGSSYVVLIIDEQRKININNALDNPNNLLLTNLFTELGISDITDLITDITGNKPPDGYHNFSELKSLCFEGLTDAKVDLIKENVTVISYVDSNTDLAPVNINTCDPMVLKSVVEGITDGSILAIPGADAENVRDAIASSRGTAAITSWSAFYDILDDLVNVTGAISQEQANVIMNNCNPNRTKPSTSTTEFCFNSGGYYEVIARGTVTDFLNNPQAVRTISAIVKIYDIYCETKTKDASGNPTQLALGAPERVTWLDSCPVNSDAIFDCYEIGDNTSAQTIAGSLKLGFWDDFETDNRIYSKEQWEKGPTSGPNAPVTDSDFANGKLMIFENKRCDLYGTDGASEWMWGDFVFRAFVSESATASTSQMKDVAWILFRNPGSGHNIPYSGDPAVIHARQGTLSWEDDEKFAYLDTSDLVGKVAFMKIVDILNSSIDPYPHYRSIYNLTTAAYPIEADRIQAAIDARYKYDRNDNGQIRILTLYKMGDNNPSWPEWENYDYDVVQIGWEWLKKDLAYTQTKTFNITTGNHLLGGDSKDIAVDVWTGAPTPASLTRKIIGAADSGRFVLYANNVNVTWDDIRIISPDGNLVSQTIDSLISGLENLADGVEWGTITGTVTIPPPPASAASETVTFQTISDSDPNGTTDIQVLRVHPEYFVSRSGEHIDSQNGTSMRYKVILQTATAEFKETPVLEDVTITYLPKVAIKSYSLSQ